MWNNQIEEDPDEGVVPDGVQVDRDSDVDVQEEEQSVNGDAIKNIDEAGLNNGDDVQSKKDNSDVSQTVAEYPNISTVNPKDMDVNMGDPCGTGRHSVSQQEVRESASFGTKQLANTQVATTDGSTIPLEVNQEGEQNIPVDQALEVRTNKSNIQIAAVFNDQGGEEHRETTSVDYDDESIAQNFRNVARQGDLSPRHLEKVKSAAKGKKKAPKDTSSLPSNGVQTRRTLNKSSAQ